jgi:hypothetical protein
VKAVDDENPTFEMHDDIRNGQVDHQLVSGGANVLVSEMLIFCETNDRQIC